MQVENFLLPWPPSVNALWRSVKGRNILSQQYRLWKRDAEEALMIQRVKSLQGPVFIRNSLLAPHNRTWDPDNFNKAVLDTLVSYGVIEDDNNRIVRELTTQVRTEGEVGALITVTAWP